MLGTLCSQNYFPLFACTSASLRMEITLVDNISKCLNIVGGVSFVTGAITNVEYIANFIELGDSAMSTVVSSLQGQPLQFVVPDYRIINILTHYRQHLRHKYQWQFLLNLVL